MGDRLELVPVDDLRPHPINARLYDERADAAFVASVGDFLHTPLIVTTGLVIVSGHRRWGAARAAGRPTVLCLIREYADDDAVVLALVEANRQREKTSTERQREADELARMAAEKRKQGPSSEDTIPLISAEFPETREEVAATLGMKRDTYSKERAVYLAAQGIAKKNERKGTITARVSPAVKAIAEAEMAKLDAGLTTVNKAHHVVNQAKKAEAERESPEARSLATVNAAFADDPGVKAARLVKLATRALESCANNLLYFTPEAMAEAALFDGDDIITPHLAALRGWLDEYQRAVRRLRGSLHVVQ